jgi:hypothetical protein
LVLSVQRGEKERSAEGEAVGDAGELSAFADFLRAEAGDEVLPEFVQERSAAGEKNGLDTRGRDLGVGEEGVEVADDRGGEVDRVLVELAARDAEVLRVMCGIFRRIGGTDSAKLRSRTRNSR